jgi:hypothetical protein
MQFRCISLRGLRTHPAGKYITTRSIDQAHSAAVPAVLRPRPLGITCPRTLGPTTHRRKKVDWTHPAIGRIRCSDACLVQLLEASGQRRIAERGGQPDASRFFHASGQRRIAVDWTHPVPDASGQRRIAVELDASSFRTHPGSDASLFTGRIQFRTHPGSDASLGNWTHPVPDASGQRRIAGRGDNWTHPVPDASGQRRIAV